jgi:hypothetical protein
METNMTLDEYLNFIEEYWELFGEPQQKVNKEYKTILL